VHVGRAAVMPNDCQAGWRDDRFRPALERQLL